MLAHISRLRPATLRRTLLALWFPLDLLHSTLHAALPVRWGGHPDKRRLLAADFYRLPMFAFVAAWQGRFVKAAIAHTLNRPPRQP